MNLIVAVDQNWGIGCNGKLLFDIPEDMKYFKEKTMYKTVVMGRKTLESLPGGKPLPGRVNIVLVAEDDFEPPQGAIVCRSLAETLDTAGKYPPEDVFIIGGGTVYKQLLEYCVGALVTKVRAVREADSFFPDLDKNTDWAKVWESEVKRHGGLEFTFTKYLNKRRLEGAPV